MSVTQQIKSSTAASINALYNYTIQPDSILVNLTKPEFEGDYTVVLFAFVKELKKSPEVLGNELGNHLIENFSELFSSFNIVKGFLNLTVNGRIWLKFIDDNH